MIQRLTFLAILAVSLAGSGAIANDPISCFKSAIGDQTFLPAHRAAIGNNASMGLETVMIAVCSKVTNTFDPVACIRSALADPAVMPTIKQNAGSHGAMVVETEAGFLCGVEIQ